MRLPFALAAVALLAASPARAARTSVSVLPFAPVNGTLPAANVDRLAVMVAEELQFRVKPMPLKDAEADAALKARADAAAKAKAEGTKAVAALAAAAGGKGKGKAEPKAKGKDKAKGKSKATEDVAEALFAAALAGAAATQDLPPLATALSKVAASQETAGRRESARMTLERLFAVLPEHTPNESVLGAALATEAEKIRQTLLDGPRGRLAVTSNPPGLQVLLDGRVLGETPVVATHVLPGEHLVLVRGPSGADYSGVVRVTAAAPAEFKAEIAPPAALSSVARAALAANDVGPQFTEPAAKLGKASSAAILLAAACAPAGDALEVRGVLVRATDGARLLLPAVPLDLSMVDARTAAFKIAENVETILAGKPKFEAAKKGATLFRQAPAPAAPPEVAVTPPPVPIVVEPEPVEVRAPKATADAEDPAKIAARIDAQLKAQREAEEAARRRRNLWLGIGGGAVAVGAAAGLVYFFTRPDEATRASYRVEWSP